MFFGIYEVDGRKRSIWWNETPTDTPEELLKRYLDGKKEQGLTVPSMYFFNVKTAYEFVNNPILEDWLNNPEVMIACLTATSPDFSISDELKNQIIELCEDDTIFEEQVWVIRNFVRDL